ncbi:hypothetical protein CBS101457_002614 [Exobasidium rhododendri]|nr:hypothetical protein CBS101457_002614 [Exobasidium rhododendri]
MSVTVPYDEETGIYRSEYTDYVGPSQVNWYDRLLGDVTWDEHVPTFIECSKRSRTLTNSSLKLQAQQLGVGLLKNTGLKPGQVVMIISGNCIEFPIVLMAAAFAGLKIAMANPGYLPHELKHTIAITMPEKIFVMTPLMKNVVDAQIPWKKVISMDAEIGRGGTLYMRKLMVSEAEAKAAKSYQPKDYNETQILPFSSGTTGLPKSVEVTHRNLVAMIEAICHVPNGVSSVKRHIGILPFYHAFAFQMNIAVPLITKSCCWILPSPFDPVLFCKIIEREKIELLCIVPPIFIVLTNLPQANRESWKSVKFLISGAAPLDQETQQRLVDKTGVEVRSGWGMTETTVGGLGLHANMKIGTCGRLLPGMEAKCVDVETGKPVKQGERGELWVRAPNVVKGYYKNEMATKETITEDGWLKTGDVATVDREGNFSIVDRIKELIKYKGYQVPPAELEGLLLHHPDVAAAAVIGVYDKSQATELPRAYIELKGGRKGAEEEAKIAQDVIEFIRKKASSQKRLRGGVRILDKVPASPSGKLLRKDLRALVKQEEESEKAGQSKL